MTPRPSSIPARNGVPRTLSVLGATGSIGRQTLDVVRLFPDRFRIGALAAGSNAELLAKQAREFSPDYAVLADEEAARELRSALAGLPTEVLTGEEALCRVAALEEVDVVMAAVVGYAGLAPVVAALEAGKTVALANKETLVVAGAHIRERLETFGGTLIPVDSEHSAIFQCLVGENPARVEELVLTASGGPFRTLPASCFAEITPAEALDHPNWSMGAKITIDSATLMNKGLEVIEARWLFDLPPERIRVLVHPQSIIHSMVSFQDGAIKAQLGVPDMKVPIQYALSYPARWPAPHERLDWQELRRLDFEPPDMERFPCLRLAFKAMAMGGAAPAVLNAANEQAVTLFLEEALRFVDIPRVIEEALSELGTGDRLTLDELSVLDREARRYVLELSRATAN